MLTLLLWLVAFFLAVAGVLRLLAGDILAGVALLLAAALIGPGGFSLFRP